MKWTHLKLTNYLFATGMVMLLIAGMVVPGYIYYDRVEWSTLVLNFATAGAAFFGWLLFSEFRLGLRFIQFAENVKILALVLPLALLVGCRFVYHPMLFLACALSIIVTMFYLFCDKSVETAIAIMAILTIVLAAVVMWEVGHLANAFAILSGGAVLVMVSGNTEHVFLNSMYLKVNRLAALVLIALGAVYTVPQLQETAAQALAHAWMNRNNPSFLELMHSCLGNAGVYATTILYAIILVYGWELIFIHKRLNYYYSIVAMIVISAWLIGDVLNTFDIEIGFLSFALKNEIDVAIWLVLCFSVLSLEEFLPWGILDRNARVPHLNADDVEEIDDMDGFWILYSILTDPALEGVDLNWLSLWEEMWFHYTELIPDCCWDELTALFAKYCDKNGVLR